MNLETLITPSNEDGSKDLRYMSITNEVLQKAGDYTIQELSEFYNKSLKTESQYELAGLRLVSAFFQVEMDTWKRNGYKKRLRECLSELGFRPSKASKLLKAGEFVAQEMIVNKAALLVDNDPWDWNKPKDQWEQEKKEHFEYQVNFLRDHGLTGLYELARMNDKGLWKARDGYRKNSNQPLPTRQLQELQKRHPAELSKKRGRGPASLRPNQAESSQSISTELDEIRGVNAIEVTMETVSDIKQLQPAEDTTEVSNTEMVEQFKVLAEAIDWSAIGECQASRVFLSEMSETLNFIADLASDSRYSPCL